MYAVTSSLSALGFSCLSQHVSVMPCYCAGGIFVGYQDGNGNPSPFRDQSDISISQNVFLDVCPVTCPVMFDACHSLSLICMSPLSSSSCMKLVSVVTVRSNVVS